MAGERTYYRPVANEFGTTYSDILTFEYGLTKCNGENITYDEQVIIERWLTSPKLSQWLEVRDTNDLDYCVKYYGKFISTTWVPTPGDGFYGMMFEFENNAPYPWIHEHHNLTYEDEDGEFVSTANNRGEFKFTCNSDELYEPIYPTVNVEFYLPNNEVIIGMHEVEIQNVTDNNQKLHLRLDAATKLCIDSRHLILGGYVNSDVMSLVSYRDVGWDVVDNIYWPKVFPGENVWKIIPQDDEVNYLVSVFYDAPHKRVGGWL